MGRNHVQFQKGLCESDFDKSYGIKITALTQIRAKIDACSFLGGWGRWSITNNLPRSNGGRKTRLFMTGGHYS
ncbi:hypothetical protein CQW49_22840 (plasmid) [Methylosinus trichosporium OB3b]|uniref:Uncharacterized protein n=1 Tax=Methylosinus trichosporium (strain ATCC 35070 / NCIMB 11131 / UNIQEM 75 / OB3b) TaxID=595536 RepID=A0A2D2D710_METT3|nr:hypothetical protein [Methylosinus trichosporium]ATQ70810.1 hypothetical protein CQW49_22840 [Methylosinus trichosporium OB3b]